MSNRDPFELVAAANPIPGLTERLPGDDEMLATIMAMPVVPARRRPRKRTMWLGGGVAVVGVGLAAFAFVREESPTNALALVCYSAAEERPAVQAGTALSPDPVATCGELWMNGQIASLDEPPPLTACVLDTGLVAVIPGTQEVCSRLGIANWVGELSDEQVNEIAFHEEVVETFGGRCVSEAEVDAELPGLMAEYGLDDWTIDRRGGYTPTRQCTAVAVDSVNKTVILISRRGTLDADE